MRILIVTGGFAGHGRAPWLIDDLAYELARQGHTVDVVVSDAQFGRPRGEIASLHQSVRAYSVGPQRVRSGRLGKLLAYVRAGIGFHTRGRAVVDGVYDLGIYTSIACFTWGLPARLRRSGVVRHLELVLWDFFPIHQVEIGRIKRARIARLLKKIERTAVSRADTVAVMSPANKRFLDLYHPDLKSNVVVVPPWSSSGTAEIDATRWSSSTLSVVFGGQLVAGRGVETLVEAARILDADLDGVANRVKISIAGTGPERERLEQSAAGLSNISFLGQLPRTKYRDFIGTAHLGIAITVRGVTPPTFPSKIVEYAGVGVPILVAVEANSDAGDIIVAKGAGYSVPAGEPFAIVATIRQALTDLETGELERKAASARGLWEEELSVRRAAQRLTAVEISSS